MLHQLINRSADLQHLIRDGYELEVKGGYGLVHHVPYVNSKKEIAYGSLVSTLHLANDKTIKPDTHLMFFTGDAPCHSDGTIIAAIQHGAQRQILDAVNGIIVSRSFSNKPANGYADYYEKFTRYIKILSVEAKAIDPNVTAQTNRVIPVQESNSPFMYWDTNSSRAEINSVTSKVMNQRVAIIGLGGTGSYILDFVSKTLVKEIHIFDGDPLIQHNAFRAPGAVSKETLDEQPKKVSYWHGIYSKMHQGIVAHPYHLDSENADELNGMDFVFICIDEGQPRKRICDALIQKKIPFVDVGIGIQVVDDALTGSLRVTTVTASKNNHVAERIPFNGGGANDYSKNIQIAELNALNAALAVIKWKKLFGIYHDLEKEHNAIYSINVNEMINDEIVA